MVLDGRMNGDAFAGFCQQFLSPELETGQIVIMDNLSSHKRKDALESIEKAGASISFLPPYSPELNPIENVFSKIKQLIRGGRPCYWSKIITSVRDALLSVTAEDYLNCIENCGYGFL